MDRCRRQHRQNCAVAFVRQCNLTCAETLVTDGGWPLRPAAVLSVMRHGSIPRYPQCDGFRRWRSNSVLPGPSIGARRPPSRVRRARTAETRFGSRTPSPAPAPTAVGKSDTPCPLRIGSRMRPQPCSVATTYTGRRARCQPSRRAQRERGFPSGPAILRQTPELLSDF
jgi:hypothetical protein